MPNEKKETEVPDREEADIVVRIVAMVVVVHVRAILIRIAEKDATTSRRLTIIAQILLTAHHRSTSQACCSASKQNPTVEFHLERLMKP